MTARFEIETITKAADFAALEPEWWCLWRRAPQATPFQSPAWLLPWWQHFHPGDLRTIAVRRDSELVLLAPLYREVGPLGRRLLPVGISLSDYLDILLDPDVPGAMDALICYLDEDAGWDRVELEELAPQAAAMSLVAPPGWTEQSSPQSACPTLLLRAEPLTALLPKGKLSKLRLARNRSDRRGSWRIRQAENAAEVMAAFDLLIALHGARWASRGERGVLHGAPVLAFQRETLPLLHAAGLARLRVLEFDGVAAAALYELVGRSWVAAYLSGLNPDFEFESPGVLIMADAIEQAAREDCAAYHFLRGQEAYKYSWGAIDCWNTKRSLGREIAR